jgi:hypothetical protein
VEDRRTKEPLSNPRELLVALSPDGLSRLRPSGGIRQVHIKRSETATVGLSRCGFYSF